MSKSLGFERGHGSVDEGAIDFSRLAEAEGTARDKIVSAYNAGLCSWTAEVVDNRATWRKNGLARSLEDPQDRPQMEKDVIRFRTLGLLSQELSKISLEGDGIKPHGYPAVSYLGPSLREDRMKWAELIYLIGKFENNPNDAEKLLSLAFMAGEIEAKLAEGWVVLAGDYGKRSTKENEKIGTEMKRLEAMLRLAKRGIDPSLYIDENSSKQGTPEEYLPLVNASTIYASGRDLLSLGGGLMSGDLSEHEEADRPSRIVDDILSLYAEKIREKGPEKGYWQVGNLLAVVDHPEFGRAHSSTRQALRVTGVDREHRAIHFALGLVEQQDTPLGWYTCEDIEFDPDGHVIGIKLSRVDTTKHERLEDDTFSDL